MFMMQGPNVMNRYTSHQFPALRILMSGQNKYSVVRTLGDAATMLISEWPGDDGEEYVVAVRTCLDAIRGTTPPNAAREALMRAADEAGIRYLSVVH
ncbi:DUF982 domain-containing protein [Rhizobium leguminosarum]|uniref:DUF982 domain-containing protein n=1 Tax=Rhizobium leguminosarum TaxID=384 RepID=A0A4Q8Y6W6_RHILE|nr:DUF982 domain-containing protein [Rhizobium leguminosarum]TAU83423.1 DUF982 domain-containing protein [Rhizobium leguminosarum]TAU88598.1 DUF982 domain-containing protein [Rhizobium leguminosarum]TAV48474.1 DUF982 domain-containing protein [Rhizobium leguminosarum]TAV53249.1 DUF982 domain-containing protein [Rhizobium leguminosarum]TAV57974.1 DUF982 domain-containing protein [Rhizobium leguminosarum]